MKKQIPNTYNKDKKLILSVMGKVTLKMDTYNQRLINLTKGV